MRARNNNAAFRTLTERIIMEETPSYAPGANQSKGCGCFVWGIIILMVVIGGSCTGLLYWLKGNLDRAVEQFADNSPSDIPELKVDPATEQAVVTKIQQFNDQLSSGAATDVLVLTSSDVSILTNYYLKTLPSINGRIEVVGNNVVAKISISLENFFYPGKWLNGTASLRIVATEGVLIVRLTSLKTAKGELPPELMKQLETLNFAQDAGKDPKTAAFLQKVKEINVADGKITIIPK